MFVGMGLVVAATSLGLVSCGTDEATTNTTTVRVGATNYVTIAPAPSTNVPVTTAPDAPGSILQFQTEYVILEGDYPSTVAAKWKVKFEDLMTLNGWTLQDNGIVPEWPGVGQTILIPAGATVPGVPPDPGIPTSTIAGTTATPTTAAPETTVATTTTTTEAPGSACGEYTVAEGDYPGLVATKLDTTVGKLNAANSATNGYSSFYVGLVINVPC
ncbi:MAG: LysM peptidoglycan-binding domain-containing protein [Actinobacteria bacterium]|nr:LysM peptidoglycan-binding domain-containing protein [Actinomycetota bacterium]